MELSVQRFGLSLKALASTDTELQHIVGKVNQQCWLQSHICYIMRRTAHGMTL